jgi:hypothetical protein
MMKSIETRWTSVLACAGLAGVLLGVSPATASAQSLIESFTTEASLNNGTLQVNGGAPTLDSGAAVFAQWEGDRGYLRTAQNYKNLDFIAEVTIGVVSGAGGGGGIAFFGAGPGVPNPYFFLEPYSDASIYVRMMPDEFGATTEVTNAGVEHEATTIDGGDGTYRVRIVWNHVSGTVTYAFQKNYAGGVFAPTFTSAPIAFGGVSNLTDDNFRVFLGGAGNATFDDLVILSLDCATGTPRGLEGQFKTMVSAARALRYPSVGALVSSINQACHQ